MGRRTRGAAVTVWMPVAMLDRLDDRADRDQVSRSALVQRAVEAELERDDSREKAAA